MATKKQKRAAALAKREAFLEEYRRQGLEAQKRSQDEYDEALQNALASNRRIDEMFFGMRRPGSEENAESDKDMRKFIALLWASLKREPTENEIFRFIMGTKSDREAILNGSMVL